MNPELAIIDDVAVRRPAAAVFSATPGVGRQLEQAKTEALRGIERRVKKAKLDVDARHSDGA